MILTKCYAGATEEKIYVNPQAIAYAMRYEGYTKIFFIGGTLDEGDFQTLDWLCVEESIEEIECMTK